MSKMTIVRHSSPSSLDQADYGSRCIVQDHYDEMYELYVQTSKDSEKPKWDLVGMFTPRTAQEYVDQLVDMRLGI